MLDDVDVYSEQESIRYLNERLTRAGNVALLDEDAGGLTRALAHLPLALSHAAAYLIDQGMTCGPYLHQFRVERRRLDRLMPAHADADAYGPAVSTSWALSITAAEASLPDSRASQAMWLAALLDPAGHPDQFWASPAVITYLNEHTDDEHTDGDRDEEVSWATLRTLPRYELPTHDPSQPVRAVTIHALTNEPSPKPWTMVAIQEVLSRLRRLPIWT